MGICKLQLSSTTQYCITMSITILSCLLLCFWSFQYTSSSSSNVLSLSVENPSEDIITSPAGVFSAGFYLVGENAFCFAIWFTQNPAVVWMANRDQPVNGKGSKLSLLKTGDLVLTDAGQFHVWSTNTFSSLPVELLLRDTGNLILHEKQGTILWQSFNFPTNTLLPGQLLTRHTKLISSRGETNHSSGFYKLFFDNDNVLRLLYDGLQVSSFYWPDPTIVSWIAGRSPYNGSRAAVLDFLGNFSSSDRFQFRTLDYGVMIQRRLKIDHDGTVRVYSRRREADNWYVSWQSSLEPCEIHGICGPNSACINHYISGRRCSCLPGYKMKNPSDWSYGCEPKFNLSCNRNESRFVSIGHAQFYGYEHGHFPHYTLKQCEDLCLKLCNCKGFQFNFDRDGGKFGCRPKTLLVNGYISPGFNELVYLRLPKELPLEEEYNFNCGPLKSVELERSYLKWHEKSLVKVFLWLVSAIGALEIVSIFLVWSYLLRTRKESGADKQSYHLTPSAFRRFSYSELKEATKGFSQEIGRGAGGIVYKGILSDQRVAAIKRLKVEANQGEGEFLAEVSTIGRLNHMNLIEMWGFCAEGKHRLLVYEYMENGSLAENLLWKAKTLDWSKRYAIALGTARALAYLHEECLEWILHCDIKPQNILLDANHQPKVADFGLSKLLNRNNLNNSSFSRIRGTRGYMAPEWILNLPITSKVDVYSYGIVVLEMITGKSSTMGIIQRSDGEEAYHRRLVTWVREKRSRGSEMVECWVEQIVDPVLESNYDVGKMEILARVALDCVEKERNARPTMSQVVEMLLSHEND